MQDEILDDDLSHNESEDGSFILTEKSTLNLYEAAKWARISALITIILTGYKFIMSVVQLSNIKSSIISEGLSYHIWSFIGLIESALTVSVTLLLFFFSNDFIKGYNLDNDDLIDNSFINLSKFFKYSVIIIGLSLIISVGYILYSVNFKYLILVIPIALLAVYFYQNGIFNSNKDDAKEISTENK